MIEDNLPDTTQDRCFHCNIHASGWELYACSDISTYHRFATPKEHERNELARRLDVLKWAEEWIERVSLTLGEDRGVLEFDLLEVECITLQREIARVAARFAAYLAELEAK